MEAVIGLEIHAQLLTKTKLFCGCSTNFYGALNSQTCEVCTGQPGALPVLNQDAVRLAIRSGLAMNGNIQAKSVFARKNYFYPDLPKGYQISQFELPIITEGHVWIELSTGRKKIGITRIHMEEDAGKSIHQGVNSFINLNRSSVPLVEIVSEPEMRTPEEAGAYMRAIHQILTFTEVCDGNLNEGSMRCDANVSVRKDSNSPFGTKVEIKNVNSFRFIEKAIEFEINRQIALINSGEKIVQETRLYDSARDQTFSMRSKEQAHDYRYFPDPDLPPLILSPALIEDVRKNLPELPPDRIARFISDYKLSEYDSKNLNADKFLSTYADRVFKSGVDAKLASNWILGDLSAWANEKHFSWDKCPMSVEHLCQLLKQISSAAISGKQAKDVFEEYKATPRSPLEIIQALGMVQVSDDSQIREWCRKTIENHPTQVADYRSGKDKLFGFLVGQTMKTSGGKANPALLNQILKEELTK